MSTLMEMRSEEVRRLRSEGLKLREIAQRTGISRSYVSQLIKDSDGSKALARKRKANCVDCGTPIRSDEPSRRGRQLRCVECHKTFAHETRLWPAERIIDAMRLWNETFGSPPTSTAWSYTVATPEDLLRLREGDWPRTSTVAVEFDGKFGNALIAAGFQPKHASACKPRNKVTQRDNTLLIALVEEGLPWREIAKLLGVSDGAARLRWKRLGGGRVSVLLKAETVIERELERFKDRRERAEADAKDAGEQEERLRIALAALQNGKP
jgi:predicted transcriptional regulator